VREYIFFFKILCDFWPCVRYQRGTAFCSCHDHFAKAWLISKNCNAWESNP